MKPPPWEGCGTVLVIGDVCDDVTIPAEAARLSREAPLPVFVSTDGRQSPGCAAYVANQLHALGVPNDLRPLAEISKTRYVAHEGHQVFRVDDAWPQRATGNCPPAGTYSFAAAVFVDYQGQPPDADLMAYLRGLGCRLVGDSRVIPATGWDGFDVVKVSGIDLGLNLLPEPSDAELFALQAGLGLDGTRLLITRGPAGAILVADGGVLRVPALLDNRPILNTSGAGDVFLSSYVAAALGAAKLNRQDALHLAAVAAGLRIRKPEFGAVVSWEEICAAAG
jgi:sugar/nucleoside kinase (ribokinase family)